MPAPTITALPPAPSRVDSPATFVTTADDFVAALPVMTTEINAFGSYLDGLGVEGTSFKTAVRVATTAAGTLATDFENGDTIDGVVLATGNRILIKNQVAPAENGIYVVAASGAPARSTDADTGVELVSAACAVSEGTANADTIWLCTTNGPITLGSTSITFAAFGGGAGYAPGGTDVAVADGGTGASTAADARTNLGAAASGAATASGLTMATNKLLGRTTASTGAIEELSLSQALDLIGSAAQGDILYRGASGWSRLGVGTAGQILKTNGASQNPSWSTISGGGAEAGVFESSPSKPLLTNFTLENAGTASAADGSFGIVLTMPSSTSNIRFLRYTAGLPGSTWDVRLRASMVTPYFTANIHHCCLFLRNSSNGRIITFAQNGGNVLSQNWSSYTSFNSGVFSFSGVYGPQGFWKRITCDGTNLVFYTSVNGVDWGQVGTVALATYITSVDQIGFGSLNGAASSVTNVDVFESFTLV